MSTWTSYGPGQSNWPKERLIRSSQSRILLTESYEYPRLPRPMIDTYSWYVSGHHCLKNIRRMHTECPYPVSPENGFLETMRRRYGSMKYAEILIPNLCPMNMGIGWGPWGCICFWVWKIVCLFVGWAIGIFGACFCLILLFWVW